MLILYGVMGVLEPIQLTLAEGRVHPGRLAGSSKAWYRRIQNDCSSQSPMNLTSAAQLGMVGRSWSTQKDVQTPHRQVSTWNWTVMLYYHSFLITVLLFVCFCDHRQQNLDKTEQQNYLFNETGTETARCYFFYEKPKKIWFKCYI